STTRMLFGAGVILTVVFLFFSSIKVVPVTYVGTIRQVFPWKTYYVVNPGTHWTLPLVSRLNLYSTRVREMKLYNIAADTNSTGRPEVFPDVVVWWRLPFSAEADLTDITSSPIDEEILLELDWKYGPDYEESFFKEKVIASVKEVTGAHEYDYLGSAREEAQDIIQGKIEAKVDRLIDITDFTVSSFSFTPDFEARLQALSQKQVELEQAQKDVLIAEQRRQEELAKAEQRAAQGQGEAKYRLELAKAEAEAFALIAAQLEAHPELLQLEWIKKWDGKVPVFMTGSDQSSFLFQLPGVSGSFPEPTVTVPVTTTTEVDR
ncbi:MAG: SPFH domain-containing protein, partial [Candidatus Roizmanbacteria bacterium]|nr:SPFH domain-containing protein [Candidatus Roizmanbacteria bacterium]